MGECWALDRCVKCIKPFRELDHLVARMRNQTLPTLHGVYSIRAIDHAPQGMGIRLHEICNPACDWLGEYGELTLHTSHFKLLPPTRLDCITSAVRNLEPRPYVVWGEIMLRRAPYVTRGST